MGYQVASWLRRSLARGAFLAAYGLYLALILLLLELPARWLKTDLRLMARLLYYESAVTELHEPSPDPDRIYRLRSEAQVRTRGRVFTTNSLGLRDRARDAVKPKGTVRILCLGGSTTFGAEVDDAEAFPARLEAALARGFRGRFEVWNAGVIAYQLWQESAFAQELIARYDPDILIFQHLNVGRRPFLRRQDYAPYFRKDPELYPENLRFLPWAGTAWGRALFARSALWRTVVVCLNHSSALPANNERFNSERVNEDRFLRFHEAYGKKLPIFVMPIAGLDPGPRRLLSSGARLIRLYDPAGLPRVPYREYLFIHPPACGYEWYGRRIADELAAALPRVFVRREGVPPAAAPCREETGDLFRWAAVPRTMNDPVENERAANLLSGLCEREPSSAGFWVARADAEARLARGAAARESLRRAQALRPGPETLLRAARVYADLRDCAAAEGVLAGLTQARPGSAAVWMARGQLAARCGQPQQALRHLRRGLSLRPDSRTLALAAEVYRRLGQTDALLALYSRAPAGAWTTVGEALACADLASARGRRAVALRCMARAEALGPEPAVRHRLALAYQSLRECGQAVRLLEGLSRERPGAAVYLKDKAVCEYLLGREVEAVRDLERALALDPGGLAAALSLGSIHARARRRSQALEVYEAALRAPADPRQAGLRRQVREAREALDSRRRE